MVCLVAARTKLHDATALCTTCCTGLVQHQHRFVMRQTDAGIKEVRLKHSLRVRKGDLVEGEVTDVVNYGVFVTFPHRHRGLLHISQISRARVDNVKDHFKVGDRVKVCLLSRLHECCVAAETCVLWP